MKGATMRASIVRPFLIAVVTASLFGAVPAAADDQSPRGSTVGALDTPSATLPGATLWSKRYTRPGTDAAYALDVSPDGSRVFVTGGSESSTSQLDYATVAYDASTGATLWSRRYTRPGFDVAYALGVSPDGSKVFVTGSVRRSTSGFYDYATVAYDASSGATLWSRRYTRPGNEVAVDLGVSPDGSRVFVTGRSEGSTSGFYDYATVAYDAATGSELWVERFNDGFASALGVSPDGSLVFVTGYTYDPDTTATSDYATVAYDAATGSELWVERYNGPGNSTDYSNAIGVSPDGSEVVVTGQSGGSTGDFDYATVAYDAATGAQLWVKRYNGPGDDTDVALALVVSPDASEVFVTGYSDGWSSAHGFDYATVAYDASTGAQLWVKRYNASGNFDDYASALGVSPDGSAVFVTGGSEVSTNGPDYATVAYHASTGSQLWVKRYTRPGTDFPTALRISPDGSGVFVTGYSDGSTSYDYATVAYRGA
jgi:TolB-like protein